MDTTETYQICKAISKRTGGPCKVPAIRGSDFCLFHGMDAESIRARKINSSKGGKAPRQLIPKLVGFKGKDSGDYAKATREILNTMLSEGLMKTVKDVAVYNSLINIYLRLEQEQVLPAKMRAMEKLLNKDK